MKAPGSFSTTQWTQVIEVIQKETGAAAEVAFNKFCEQYRPVIVGFFRARGWDPDQAEDHAHDFFASRILSRMENRDGFLFRARRGEAGSFRSFLASILWHYHYDALKKALSQRAGGKVVRVPIDEIEFSQISQTPPDAVFHETDLAVAQKVLDDAVGESTRSEALLDFLHNRISVKEGAARLEISEGNFKVAVHRLVERLRGRLRTEVAKLVGPNETEISGELEYLIKLLGQRKL